MFVSFQFLTCAQLIILFISYYMPKPSLRWINLTRWNPELCYFFAYVSQTIFPAAEFIILLVIVIDHDEKTYDLMGPFVFFMLMDVGLII